MDPRDDPRQLAERCEIAFDGRRYLYRQYRYDRLDDALRYAQLDRQRPGFTPDPAFRPRWDPPLQPDAAQQALMAPAGIGFADGYYLFGGYRYERLEDALAYVGKVSERM